MSPTTPPTPTYAHAGAALNGDPRLLKGLAQRLDWRRQTWSAVIPVRSGLAWEVPAGQIVRFSVLEGPQVLDVNLWHRHDPRERFWAARTRQFHGTHVTTGDRLWSTLPFLRPLATFVADTVGYGVDDDGAGCHDLLGTRCDPYVNELLSGTSYDFHCHSNLTRAIAPFGLTEFDVHDVINLFQVTGLTPGDGRYFMKTSPGRPGDYVELLAETDLLIAASTCPGGDLSQPIWGAGQAAEPRCHPIGVDVFELAAEALQDWRPAARSSRPMVGDELPPVDPQAPRPPLTSAVPISRS